MPANGHPPVFRRLHFSGELERGGTNSRLVLVGHRRRVVAIFGDEVADIQCEFLSGCLESLTILLQN
jgi:hypothetical protein